MPVPLSSHQSHRLRSLFPRLKGILALLDGMPDPRAPLTAGLAGPALRTIAEARALAGLGPHGLVAKGLAQSELRAETASVLALLTRLKHQDLQASPRFRQKSYPRAVGWS